MPTLDIFKTDAFTARALTASINAREYLPGYIGRMGLFEARPVATTGVWVEERGDELTLVPNTPRGGSPELLSQAARKRTARSFQTLHLPKVDRITADEIQDVRAFGSETELQTMQMIVNERMEQLARDIDLTLEHLMLGCIKGTIVDADGSTIYNLFTEFGVSQESEVDFDLDNALATTETGALRQVCTDAVRTITRNCSGGLPQQIVGLCGDAFWDDLVNHPEVRGTYLNTMMASDLRGGTAWGEMTYGGIRFVNYRGTDDGTTHLCHTDKVYLFPVGVPGLFVMHFAPSNRIRTSYLGAPFYAYQFVDPQERFVDVEVQSNPLPLCTKPKVLMLGKRT